MLLSFAQFEREVTGERIRDKCRAWRAAFEIKRTYRKLAFNLHPDVGDQPDETRFREAHEAYQALIQMEQGRSHRIKVERAPDRSCHMGAMHAEPRGRPEPFRRNVRST